MTTIAATRSAMAADQIVTYGSAPKFRIKKLVVVGDSIFGFCGVAAPALRFIQWRLEVLTNTKASPPEFGKRDKFDALELDSSGLYLWDQELAPYTLLDDFYAIGSGSYAAISALKKTPDVVIAVQAAIDADPQTGGNIDVIQLSDVVSAKPKRKRT